MTNFYGTILQYVFVFFSMISYQKKLVLTIDRQCYYIVHNDDHQCFIVYIFAVCLQKNYRKCCTCMYNNKTATIIERERENIEAIVLDTWWWTEKKKKNNNEAVFIVVQLDDGHKLFVQFRFEF